MTKRLVLGAGDDVAQGDWGAPDFEDLIYGLQGDDTLSGGTGDDSLYGSTGSDSLSGGLNNDFLKGDDDNDVLIGNTGDDVIFGGQGDDEIHGERGSDYLSGEDGDDALYFLVAEAPGFFDTVNGGLGYDVVNAATTIYLDKLISVEEIVVTTPATTELVFSDANNEADLSIVDTTLLTTIRMGDGDDRLIDNGDDHDLFGGAGDDEIQGGSGSDDIFGGSGADTILAGAGSDYIYFGAAETGYDVVDGGDGLDLITVGDGTSGYLGDNTVIRLEAVTNVEQISGSGYTGVRIEGSEHSNLLDFTSSFLLGIEKVSAGAGTDTVLGSFFDDVIEAGAGNDELFGGGGYDTIDGETGDDTVFFTGNYADYDVPSVLDSNGYLVVTDLRPGGPDGVVKVKNVEYLVFADTQILVGVPSNIAPTNVVDTNAAANLVTENLDTAGTAISGLALSSTDTAGDGVEFQLVDDAGGRFQIDPVSGVITVKDANLIDYETATSHSIQVRTFDGIASSTTQTITISVANFTEFETYAGTSGNDTASASTVAVWTMSGLAGNDTLTGNTGADILIGGEGNDTLNGAAGNDSFQYSGSANGFDSVAGGSDTDTIIATDHNTVIGLTAIDSVEVISSGGYTNVSVAGSGGNDTLNLTGVTVTGIASFDMAAGNDAFTGTAGNDVVSGGSGNDTLNGGDGNDLFLTTSTAYEADSYTGGLGSDTILATAANTVIGVAAMSGIEVISGGGLGNVSLSVSGTFDFTSITLDGISLIQGGTAADSITGSTLADKINGGLANDTIYGGNGNDTITGGPGGNSGNDVLYGGNGDDTFMFLNQPQNDTYYGGDGWDVIAAAEAGVSLIVGSGSLNTIEEISSGIFASANIQVTNGPQNINLSAIKLTNIGKVVGGFDNDTITTGTTDDYLDGGNGNDSLIAGGGNDTLEGKAGTDRLNGGAGNDRYIIDTLDIITELAGEGTDIVIAGHTYTLGANLENLTLTGNTTISGTGNSLDNTLTGNTAANTLTGGAGNDTYVVDSADTIVENAGEGDDTVVIASTYTLLENFENLTLTGVDTISGTGNSADNVLTGNGSANTLTGLTGNDTYVIDGADTIVENAGEGTDTVVIASTYTLLANFENLTLAGSGAIDGAGNTGANVITGNAGNNVLDGGAGVDTVLGLDGSDTLLGGAASHADSLDGGAGNDSLFGGERWDTLVGGDGNDTLDGGQDNDQMYGGLGDDVYYVDHIGDRVYESLTINEGADTVYASITWDMTSNTEAVVLTGTGNTSSIGNSLHNTMTGNSGDNTFSGGVSHDTIYGMDGNDSIDGGIDSDVMYGGNGNDTILGGQRWDSLIGGDGDDVLDGGTENDQMTGGLGNDTYYVDHVGDRTNESTTINEGYDLVYASIDWNLSSNFEAIVLTGAGNTSSAGNSLHNSMTGNSGHNGLSGANGNDTLAGGDGNDSLNGGSGHDNLTGGAGVDDFVFSTLGTNGIDTITDFTHAIDRLVFTGADYGFSAGHNLTTAQFTVGSSAVGMSGQFIWNAANGHLYWDADGSGAGAAVDLALFGGATTLSSSDLQFV